MKVKAADADRFLARLDAAIAALLFHGPDQGLAGERVRRVMQRVAGDLEDPFKIADLDAESLRQAPERLFEEVQALSLTGGRRVVRIRRAADAQAGLFADLLALPRIEALVLVEAGDLPARSPLRKTFENARTAAAAVPCYRDEARDLGAAIDDTLSAAGLGIEPAARAHLLAHLGSDREVTRRELEKLVLYMQGAEPARVSVEDADAVIGDSSALDLDDLVWAVLTGEGGRAETILDRLLTEGRPPVSLVRTLSATVMRLIPMSLQVAQGTSARQVIDDARPPVFFRTKPAMRRTLERWDAASLGRALAELSRAERLCKSTGMPERLILQRLVLDLTTGAPRAQGEPRGRIMQS
ncbi:MAG: DNA polymerase III subunit delta [Geminicoccaceae bacterium]|nr:DNA polymerase III subunit delta [Geminicoccaceae bacterium]